MEVQHHAKSAPKGGEPIITRAEWTSIVARYQGSNIASSIWQMVNTLLPLAGTLWLMHHYLHSAPWVTALLVLPAAGLLMRTFIIMHDCAHGSFLPWPRVNDVIGFITGVMTVTPYVQWRRDHALHHASSGDLERRGHGDVPTLTVREYMALTPRGRLKYRLIRHPLSLMLVGPLHFMVGQRFRGRSKATRMPEIMSVWLTNLAIVAVATVAIFTAGAGSVFLVYLPTMYVAAAIGIWLFYVQHQFEDAYWETHGEWDYATACIAGSSHLRLNPIMRWFTGNIGLHHVHHLGPRIPNYRLQKAHNENAIFEKAPVMTFRHGFRCLRLALYDEESRRLVPFKDVKAA